MGTREGEKEGFSEGRGVGSLEGFIVIGGLDGRKEGGKVGEFVSLTKVGAEVNVGCCVVSDGEEEGRTVTMGEGIEVESAVGEEEGRKEGIVDIHCWELGY